MFGGSATLGQLLVTPAGLGQQIAANGLPNVSFSLEDQTLGGYLPLNSEVSTQRRLRVTKGIYLPADVPMHGIFGSKDVIHS